MKLKTPSIYLVSPLPLLLKGAEEQEAIWEAQGLQPAETMNLKVPSSSRFTVRVSPTLGLFLETVQNARMLTLACLWFGEPQAIPFVSLHQEHTVSLCLCEPHSLLSHLLSQVLASLQLLPIIWLGSNIPLTT